MTQTADVLIAGAGPVGLSLAAALVRQGVSVAVCEALPELSREARASTLHPPTLEMFEAWGVVDQILAKGRRIQHLQFWERQTRELVADFPYSLIADDTRYPFRLQCPQSTVTRCILPIVAASGRGNVHFNHRAQAARDCGTHAELDLATPEGVTTWRGKYVVGADGARSQVRESLGLGFTGATYEDRFLLVGTDLDLSPMFPQMGPVAYIFDPHEWVIVMHLPQVVRLVFRLRTDEEADAAQEETAVRARVAAFLGTDAAYQLQGVWVYRVHQRVTERFRVGRVLLAGDAAHINNPTGGMGLNSGIHDAHHLANALVGVLSGASETLLDDYAETRRRVATDMVQRVTDANYKNLTSQDEGVRAARNRELRAAAQNKSLARAYLLRTAMLEERI